MSNALPAEIANWITTLHDCDDAPAGLVGAILAAVEEDDPSDKARGQVSTRRLMSAWVRATPEARGFIDLLLIETCGFAFMSLAERIMPADAFRVLKGLTGEHELPAL
jgi:hypothetical protein